MNDRLPLVDLAWQHRQIVDEIMPTLEAAMAAGQFVGGPEVDAFESEFAASCGTTHCIGVANGTDAIELALRAAGIGPGDRVVVPANTFIATVEGVVAVGATPEFVDVTDDYLIDINAAVAAVEQGARAVLPVHLYGQTTATAELVERTAAHRPLVIEDAAQSQGALVAGVGMGARCTAATTSFYPGKNLGAYGDAGAVVTQDSVLADAIRLVANHGSRIRYRHEVIGRNSRLDTLQAIVLRAKLARLADWNDLRRAAASRYDDLLSNLPLRTPERAPGQDHVWHLYVVRVPDRDRVLEHLNTLSIGAAIHYPVPAHLHEATKHLGYVPGAFPRAERHAPELLSLPLYPGITTSDQERVAQELAVALR